MHYKCNSTNVIQHAYYDIIFFTRFEFILTMKTFVSGECPDDDSCTSMPCQNGATCLTSEQQVYICVCPTFFSGMMTSLKLKNIYFACICRKFCFGCCSLIN